MNTAFIKKQAYKHSKTAAWSGTFLAIATLAFQTYQEHDSNKTLQGRNTALWSRIQSHEQEISDLKGEIRFLEGYLSIQQHQQQTNGVRYGLN